MYEYYEEHSMQCCNLVALSSIFYIYIYFFDLSINKDENLQLFYKNKKKNVSSNKLSSQKE